MPAPPTPTPCSYALENCKPDLDFFDANVEEGLIARLNNVLSAPFQRITYTDAVALLLQPEHMAAGAFEETPFWGIDLGSEHERYLTEKVFKKPTIVTDYPASFKAFYMKQNDDGKVGRFSQRLWPRAKELESRSHCSFTRAARSLAYSAAHTAHHAAVYTAPRPPYRSLHCISRESFSPFDLLPRPTIYHLHDSTPPSCTRTQN